MRNFLKKKPFEYRNFLRYLIDIFLSMFSKDSKLKTSKEWHILLCLRDCLAKGA